MKFAEGSFVFSRFFASFYFRPREFWIGVRSDFWSETLYVQPLPGIGVYFKRREDLPDEDDEERLDENA